jgi:hypothetical protein
LSEVFRDLHFVGATAQEQFHALPFLRAAKDEAHRRVFSILVRRLNKGPDMWQNPREPAQVRWSGMATGESRFHFASSIENDRGIMRVRGRSCIRKRAAIDLWVHSG